MSRQKPENWYEPPYSFENSSQVFSLSLITAFLILLPLDVVLEQIYNLINSQNAEWLG